MLSCTGIFSFIGGALSGELASLTKLTKDFSGTSCEGPGSCLPQAL
jgi:hypothetical protein